MATNWRELVLYWHLALFAAMDGMRHAVRSLKEHGATQQLNDRVAGYRDYAHAVELNKWIKIADGYKASL